MSFSTRQQLNAALSAWNADSAAATAQYGDINTWDVSAITDMSQLFMSNSNFNSNISSWNVSNVTTMSHMFYYATSFNQPLNSWNVSKVTDMSLTFYAAFAFNQPINSWDVSQVTDTHNMFDNAQTFNQPLNSWNVSNVVNMSGMFSATHYFNQPLNSWNVSKVTNMSSMFFGLEFFNQDIRTWPVGQSCVLTNIFYYTPFMSALAGSNTPLYSWFNQASGPVISNTCFPAGTPVLTNQGKIPIEKLQPHIHTIRNKTIVGITQTITPDKNLVCFEKDALGPNIPSEKTVVSKNHGIFYKGKMMKAKSFVGEFDNVYKVKYTGEVLYNVLMEEHDKMMVNNLICETLHPENSMAKIYMVLQKLSPKGQEELIRGCNEHIVKNKIFNSKQVTKKM